MKKDTPNGLQRDIFTEQISVFSCPITSPDSISHHHTRTIGQVIDAGVKYADNVQHIRQARLTAMSAHRQGDVRGYDIAMEQYKQMKANAHFCIFQGICPQRNDNAMEQYSRVLCLDLDAPKPTDRKPPNTWVNDWEQVKATISQLPFVAYCGLSIGGMGLFVLIPIKEPARHKEYFNTLASLFKKHLRLDVDLSASNISRARFISYDPAPYINHQAVEWDKVLQPSPSDTRATRGATNRRDPNGATQATTLTEAEKNRVMACVDWCIKGHVSIADNYDDWMRLAAFFAHNWSDGEGEALFHELAGLSDKYDVWENDRKLENMKAAHPRPATLHTFYRLCLNHGCPIPNDWRMTSSSRRLVKFRPIRSRQEVEADNMTKQGAAPRQETPQEAINTPVTSPTVQRVIVTPPPMMSAGERQELKRHQGDIEKGRSIIARWCREREGFSQLMEDFNLDLAGLDDWCMTPAQVYAVSTGAF